MALIEVRDLEKTYYNDGVQTPALRGVSFSISKGEFVAVMGPSGSGKSTLLHILGFLDRHTRGEYRFENRTIDEHSKEEIAHIRNKKMGFVFQTFNLLPRTTVLENIKLPLLYSEVKESNWDNLAKTAIEAVGLSHRIDHSSSQLSGGERQRVAIARALVNSPYVIFADEPTGNLDSKSGRQVMEYIKKLHTDGNTVVLITHEAYIAQYAQRVIEFHDGKIKTNNLMTRESVNQ